MVNDTHVHAYVLKVKRLAAIISLDPAPDNNGIENKMP